MKIFFPLWAFPNTLYAKKGSKTPTQVNESNEKIHISSKAKIKPNTPKAMMQMLDAKPSMPSIRLIAFVINMVNRYVKGEN